MGNLARRALLVLVGCAVLLTGCTADSASERKDSAGTRGPVATTTVAPDAAARLAERYRSAGGVPDVYGIGRSADGDGVPLLTVWTHDPDEDDRPFQELKKSVTRYLAEHEGLSLEKGYLMDVFGPDGSLQHRLDARV
ncbi:hypothetical protein OG599_13980 [Streptomyces sp. NBC_01335]|uniref:hypothetical protein n=1 Tax=Streptomyces sp. NBC_01335 TaxID=2903828 RepID=UPI002E0DE254|nr:hypothetical protein OG599_13980 [Streptomyces sp. NBC_01335]